VPWKEKYFEPPPLQRSTLLPVYCSITSTYISYNPTPEKVGLGLVPVYKQHHPLFRLCHVQGWREGGKREGEERAGGKREGVE
jgi:hypothetical protein